MNWTAIVPIKPPSQRKGRLSGHLSAEGRDRLAEAMLCHVHRVLWRADQVDRVVLLAAQPLPWWGGDFLRDRGRGINLELNEAARQAGEKVLVINADLPLVTAEDIDMMLNAAHDGVIIAPDRHGTGTNALASFCAPDFSYQFGPHSSGRHIAAAHGTGHLFENAGLAVDIDTADDIAVALATWPFDPHVEGALRHAAEEMAQPIQTPRRANG